jgi:hypothetical protein
VPYFLAIVIAGSLVACATPPYPIVEKDGVSTQEMNRDMADCVQQRDSTVSFGPFISRCMESKGYRVLVRNS